MSTQKTAEGLIDDVASAFGELLQVSAVALGGSRRRHVIDINSDVDLYVYINEDIPLTIRESIVIDSGGASRANLGMNFWGTSDEWFDAVTGLNFDIIYFEVGWIEAQIRRVVDEHQASTGYTTCFWYTVRNAQILHDPDGWYKNLQTVCHAPYPEPLRENIIYTNHPLLRTVIPSYRHQIQMALARQDMLSVNHRLTEFFTCYFDVIFALNRQLHPGEKRLVPTVLDRCTKVPEDFANDVDAVLKAGASGEARLLDRIDQLLNHLDDLLAAEGFSTDHMRPISIP